jgi:hypothetical protein
MRCRAGVTILGISRNLPMAVATRRVISSSRSPATLDGIGGPDKCYRTQYRRLKRRTSIVRGANGYVRYRT